MNILIIDDEPLIRQIVAEELLALGHIPIVCNDVDVIIWVLEQYNKNIDIVMLDAAMPEDTFIIYKQLKTLLPDARIICMSGYSVDNVRVKLLIDAGADYLAKPFTTNDLRSIL